MKKEIAAFLKEIETGGEKVGEFAKIKPVDPTLPDKERQGEHVERAVGSYLLAGLAGLMTLGFGNAAVNHYQQAVNPDRLDTNPTAEVIRAGVKGAGAGASGAITSGLSIYAVSEAAKAWRLKNKNDKGGPKPPGPA